MKYIYNLLILCFMVCLSLNGRSQNSMFEWSTQSGGNFDDVGFAIKIVDNGDVLITGYFEDTVDFDPGSGLQNLISLGEADMFIQKLDANGNLLWVRQIGGVENVLGLTITTDANGNIYASGSFRGTVDFEPGPGITNQTSNGSEDIFVVKLDPIGNLIWVKTMGGIGNDSGQTIKMDLNGDVYVCGHFHNTVDFDPNMGTSNLVSNGSQDCFILKLDLNGNFIWVKQIGSNNTETVGEVEFDPSNNVYVAGGFQWIVDFDPGPSVLSLTSNGSWDYYLQKLTTNGDFVWVKQMGGTGQELGYGLEIDSNGNIFSTGRFSGTVDFDPGSGTTAVTSNGAHDIFLHKLDANGDFLWVKSFGSTGYDYGFDLSLDAAENIYVTGYFQDSVDFDPSLGTFNLFSNGVSDIFVSKQDNNGDFLWVKQAGGVGNDRGRAIGTFGDDVYVTGYFEDSVDFNPGAEEYNQIGNGEFDVFVLKLTACQTSFGIDQIVACDSLTWLDGNTYTTSNNSATFLSTNVIGCDSIITLNLTILNSSIGTDVRSECAPFAWIDGNTYLASTDTVTWTLTNAVGCDSVVTLDLTINNNSGIDQVTACDSYAWIDGNTYTSSNNSATYTLTNTLGCDSLVTLDLTINNSNAGTDMQIACDSYIWIDGNTYTSSTNTPTWTLTNAQGCDSLVTLDLIINSVDASASQFDDLTIQADQSGLTYQWLNCDNNMVAISGETNQSFTATQNGNYAVQVTNNGCVDTSACIAITNVGIVENDFGNALTVSPNPTNGKVQVSLGNNYDNVSIQLLDAKGRLIQSRKIEHTDEFEVLIDGASGYYILDISAGEKRAIIKVLKK